MGTRRKARECALQMLFAADVAKTRDTVLTRNYWAELGEPTLDEETREFADNLTIGTLDKVDVIDATIRTRAEHWRIERMAIVDRNVLRMAVYEFLFSDTPHTVIINEALEIARRFSTFEATQFINGILDAIKHDLEKKSSEISEPPGEKTQASSS
jgi:N utilization substance protein B